MKKRNRRGQVGQLYLKHGCSVRTARLGFLATVAMTMATLTFPVTL